MGAIECQYIIRQLYAFILLWFALKVRLRQAIVILFTVSILQI